MRNHSSGENTNNRITRVNIDIGIVNKDDVFNGNIEYDNKSIFKILFLGIIKLLLIVIP